MFQNIQYWDKGKLDLWCWLLGRPHPHGWDELMKSIKEVVWDKLSVSRHSPPYPGMDWWLLSHCLANERKIREVKKKMWDHVEYFTMVVHVTLGWWCTAHGRPHWLPPLLSHSCWSTCWTCATHQYQSKGLFLPDIFLAFSILWFPYGQRLSSFTPRQPVKIFEVQWAATS